MQVEQTHWTSEAGWRPRSPGGLRDADLVLLFGSFEGQDGDPVSEVRSAYPGAWLLGGSTAGEIQDVRVTDDSLALTAIRFEQTRVWGTDVAVSAATSFEAGQTLATQLAGHASDLVHVFVVSEGLDVNGSALVAGLTEHLPSHVSVTGGLSGDGTAMERTRVLWGDQVRGGRAAAVGFYGTHLKVGCGSLGGWDSFGPERRITRSEGNVLYELDGQSALALYRRYLGDHANDLPAAGLLFPLSLRSTEDHSGVVRTILGIDEDDQSLIFAGDVPEGSLARLMKANFNRLLDGAAGAAETSAKALAGHDPALAILISCVGRRMVLKQRIEEEVEAAREILGPGPALTGFYSYGEISPFTPEARCELHNQTMTITTFAELREPQSP